MPGYVARMGRSDGSVRDVHSASQFGGIRVPVFTPDPRGDRFEGHIRVQNELTLTKMFTNERHRFNDLIAENIRRWVEWREKKGWVLNSKPKVQGPYEAPTANAQEEVPDWSIYIAEAWFKPTEVMTVSIDDGHELERRARLYGVDITKTKPTSTPIESGPDVIHDKGGFSDPMVIADKRRKAMGVNREDYLMGPLSEPMKKPE